jgi:tRNA threonylcarbamoyladenosine biosynthesis protein TsaB
VQHFDPLARPVSQLRAMTRTQLVGQLPEGLFYVCGTGAQHLTARSGLEISLEPCIATAASAARASLDLAMTVPPKPLYLRAPDAKPQAGFAIARTGA